MNLLVTGAWKDAKEYLDEIKKMGHEVRFLQYETENLPCDYGWVEGVICNGLFLHHPIERFTRLKYIQLTSAGYDRVPMDYIKEKGIRIYNSRGVYSIPMAEWAVMRILEIYKNANAFFEKQKEKRWEKDFSLSELTDKKVCIVGYGSVGRETAKRLAAFGTEITVVNRSKVVDGVVRQCFSLEQINKVLPEADIVILCIALSEKTRGVLGEEQFRMMKQGGILVNIARGELIDEKALIRCMEERKFRGVALDVFKTEPLPAENELWEMPGMFISPHNSFVGNKVTERMFDLIRKNLIRI